MKAPLEKRGGSSLSREKARPSGASYQQAVWRAAQSTRAQAAFHEQFAATIEGAAKRAPGGAADGQS